MARSEDQDNVQDDALVIPEDLTELSREDLDSLHERAVTAFRDLRGDGSGLSADDVDTLKVLGKGIERISAEVKRLDEVDSQNREEADAIASRLGLDAEGDPEEGDPEEDTDSEEEGDSETEGDQDTAVVEDPELEAVAASGEIRVNLPARARRREVEVDPENRTMKDITFAADGSPVDRLGMAKLINKRLDHFNEKAYASAARAGRKMGERFPIATITREFDDRLVVKGENADSAINFAVDESRLPKGSLLASGGWCAPSETSYDLCNLSDAADLIDLPEIQINRGGLRFTTGPDYASVFGDTGFCYTEEEDIEGDYDGAGGGTKPCFHVPCPDFEEERLGYCGICITAGLLQQKGYPEAIANFIDIALNAHAHRVSAAVINDLVTQSTAVSLATGQAGAVAPLLTAIDLQAAHYRAVNRMRSDAPLEIVLPTWTRVIVRADLARRQGVDLLSVPDARINAWFSERYVNPQYVVDWQDIATTPASGFIATPTTVDFLLYAAGTFVKGVTDSITFENIYDSVGLGTNDYTALFTEDPYLIAKRCHDSRVVTVPVCTDGATHIGVEIDCDGTAA